MNSVAVSEAGLGARSVFEQIFELIDRHTEEFGQDKFSLGDFYEIVIEFDESFKIFNSDASNKENIKFFNDLLEEKIGSIIPVFKVFGFRDSPIFFAFKRFISFFSFVLKESGKHKRQEDVNKIFNKNFPSLSNPILGIGNETILRELTKLAENGFRIEDIEGISFKKRRQKVAYNAARGGYIGNALINFLEEFPTEIIAGYSHQEPRLTVYCNDFVVKTIFWKQRGGYHVARKQFYTTISIYVEDEHNDASKLLEPVYLITAAIKQIKNTSVTIESISKGSIHVEVEVRSNDLVAKEELNSALEVSKKKLIDSFNNNPLLAIDASSQKVDIKEDIEIKKLNLEVLSKPTAEEVKLSRKLDNERKKLENELLKAQLAEAKIRAIKKVSKLIRKGIVQSDQIQISINGIMYLLKVDNTIQDNGSNISDIT